MKLGNKIKFIVFVLVTIYSSFTYSSEKYFTESNNELLALLKENIGKSISVVDIVNFDKKRTELSSFVESELTKELVLIKKENKIDVKIITRSRLEQIQKEKKGKDKALIKSDNKNIGVIQGADILITGNITEDGKYFSIHFEAIDVYTGEVTYAFKDKLIKEPDLEKKYNRVSENNLIYGGKISSNKDYDISKFIDSKNIIKNVSVKMNRCTPNENSKGIRCSLILTALKANTEVNLFNGNDDYASYFLDKNSETVASDSLCIKNTCTPYNKKIMLILNRPLTISYIYKIKAIPELIKFFSINLNYANDIHSFSFGNIEVKN